MHELTHGTKMSAKLVQNLCSPMHENDRDHGKAIALFREFGCQLSILFDKGFFLKY